MGVSVLIIGRSGSGKSASLRNFEHDEVAVVNVANKPLPFKGKFDSFLETDDYNKVVAAIKSTKKKVIVIDDAGYLITNYFMKNQAANSGNNVFAMYTQMAEDFWKLIRIASGLEDKEKIVYFMMHEEGDEINGVKPKTIGKMLDEKVCVEGMFTIVLRADCTADGEHVFHTKNNGQDVTKAPMGMFSADTIDNDLKAVDAAIRDFYEMPKLKKGDK